MHDVYWARTIGYSILPLILAAGHIALDHRAGSSARRIEIVLLYLFAVSVGAGGLGGAFGHLFLSDLVAEGIGWPAGSPFQLEMGYANLALGILGLLAVGRRDGFRTATIIAVTVVGGGATLVHLQDMVAHGNLAPGNTVQNISNLLDPILLIGLSLWATRLRDPDAQTAAFARWQMRRQPIAGMAAAGIGTGFALGFAAGIPIIGTLGGALLGVAAGVILSRQAGHGEYAIAPDRSQGRV